MFILQVAKHQKYDKNPNDGFKALGYKSNVYSCSMVIRK